MPTEADGTASMGQLLDKLVEVGSTYRECQAAALGRTNTGDDTARASGARLP